MGGRGEAVLENLLTGFQLKGKKAHQGWVNFTDTLALKCSHLNLTILSLYSKFDALSKSCRSYNSFIFRGA